MFSKIIYINLDRRPDRNENVINQLKNINYNGRLERFSAIDSKKLDINMMPNNIFTKKAIDDANDTTGKLYNVMTKGAIGCTLSHKLIYEKILYGEDEYVLILEDDITFDDNFIKKYTDIIKKIPKYDILYLGYHNKNDLKNHNSYDVPRELWGLFGYIINKKAAKKLLEVFPITAQIDSEISRAYPDLKVYALKEDERIISSDTSQTSYRFGTDIQTREGFSSSCQNYFTMENIIVSALIILCIYNMIAINKNPQRST